MAELSYGQINDVFADWRVAEMKLRSAIQAAKRAEHGLAALVADLPDDLVLEGPFPGDHPDWLKPLAKAWLGESNVAVSAMLEGRTYEEVERVKDGLNKLRTEAQAARGGAI